MAEMKLAGAAGVTTGHPAGSHPVVAEPVAHGRRDFLIMLPMAGAVVGAGAIAWPLVDSMNPSGDVLALSSTEVDLGTIPEGSGITVLWRGKPIFVRYRTAAEIKGAQDVKLASLIEPQADQERVKPGHDQWIVLIGICTHLGCVPLGNKPTQPRGEWGGWLCPCHGSQYDVSGRVRHGPAPLNLWLPPYAFLNDKRIRIG